MFGLSKKQPVSEHEASGDIERVYHEIKRTLRVSGVNLNFRTWAAHGEFLVVVWDAFRPALETRAFEESADTLRSEAAQAAVQLGVLGARDDVPLGESQAYQLQAALDLYHYVNPKLLLLTSLVGQLLRDGGVGRPGPSTHEQIPLGPPAKMFPMEMESDDPDDDTLKQLYRDIQDTLSLPSVNSDYRTLALWPDYLAVAWKRLKPVVQTTQYQELTDRLRETSRSLAQSFPYRVELSRKAIEERADFDQVVQVTDSFERLLPGLIINVALLESDWRSGDELLRSPFPITS